MIALKKHLRLIAVLGTLASVTILLALFLPTVPLPTVSSASAPPGYFWLGLEVVTDGLQQPTGVTSTGSDDRLFVLERTGVIRVVQNGQVLATPFLDIQDKVNSDDNWEQGLLGLAFHLDYVNNGYFFVNYTNNESDSHISRFKVSDGDPNVADPNSEEIVILIDQPTVIHNGGGLAFGAEGYLYASLGDGGWLSDPQDQAQNTELLLGKILRLDVSVATTGPFYTVPPDNPFVGVSGTADEIWAVGFRNPWRITFDRQTGDLFIGDVGNFRQEEVNFQPA
jgi:glucose/arabinose dehydrogenase